jgi:hypothetical protein
MPSGRFTRVVAFTVLVILCVSAGVWLAPRVRNGPAAAGDSAQAAPVEAFRADPGTALLHVLPPPGSASDATDAAWQRTIATHAARIARPEVLGEVVGSTTGAAAKTRWHAAPGTPGHAGAVAALRRATSVRTVSGTALIAVRVDVDSAADAAELTNDICRVYLKACQDADSTFNAYHGKQVQLDRLAEERARLGSRILEQQMRHEGLNPNFTRGTTEVVTQVREQPEYLRASARLDQLESELDAMNSAGPVDAKAILVKEKQRDWWRARLDRLRKEVAAELVETLREQTASRFDALQADAQRVDRLLDEVSSELAELREKRARYGMSHISRSEIHPPAAAIEWVQKATAAQ